jgi:hypothetical protein
MNTMSVDEYRRLVGTNAPSLAEEPAKKPAKYRNEPVVIDGIRFDSKAEARRWGQLKLLERAGEIVDLERQTSIPYCVKGKLIFTYRADATYQRNGALVVEDTKGGDTTPLYRLKKKLIEAEYGIKITEIRP